MSGKILFVDDERQLLNSIERSFGLDYDLTTADSGPKALEVLMEHGPFDVIVTDMRMPEMDGVKFICKARQIANDSIYMMLTGNQDLDTAASAVNDGQVFRFLNKPCNNESLKAALDAALEYHAALHAEKELLNKTFLGTISALTAIMGRINPELHNAGSEVSKYIESLCELSGIADRWEYKLAGHITPLCFAMSKDDLAIESQLGPDAISKRLNDAQETFEFAADKYDKIPRLGNVAEIIRTFCKSDGHIPHFNPLKDEQVVAVGASLVRIAIQAYFSQLQGVQGKELASEIIISLSGIPRQVLDAIEKLSNSENIPGKSVNYVALRAGMVLNEDLCVDGNILLRSGKRLSDQHLEKIKPIVEENPAGKLDVTLKSYEACQKLSLSAVLV